MKSQVTSPPSPVQNPPMVPTSEEKLGPYKSLQHLYPRPPRFHLLLFSISLRLALWLLEQGRPAPASGPLCSLFCLPGHCFPRYPQGSLLTPHKSFPSIGLVSRAFPGHPISSDNSFQHSHYIYLHLTCQVFWLPFCLPPGKKNAP